MAEQTNPLVISVSNIAFVTTPEGLGVHLHFSGADSQGEIRVNGYVPVTQSEYFVHAQSMESLADLAREKVMAKFEPAQGEPAAE